MACDAHTLDSVHRRAALLASVALGLLAAEARADAVDGRQSSVVSVGDTNGDGREDFLVASRDRSAPELVWLISGADGSVRFTFRGKVAGEGFGCTLAAAGDVDHDGVPDLLIATSGSHYRTGTGFIGAGEFSIQLRSGRTGALIRELAPPHSTACERVSLASGDLDGDGVPDVLVGVSQSRIGHVRAYRRIDGKELFSLPLETTPGDPGTPLGAAVSIVGDVDLDGAIDFAVSDPCARREKDPAHYEGKSGGEGRVLLYSGRDRKEIAVAWGDRPEDLFGANLAALSDVDADGRPDVLVAAENRYVRVLSGKDLNTIASVGSRLGYLQLDSFGSSLAACGDLDGDGHPDFVVGADESFEGFFDWGYAQVYSASTGRLTRTIFESDSSGVDVAPAGHINGDDIGDFALVLHKRELGEKEVEPGGIFRLVSGKDGSTIREVDLVKLREQATTERADKK